MEDYIHFSKNVDNMNSIHNLDSFDAMDFNVDIARNENYELDPYLYFDFSQNTKQEKEEKKDPKAEITEKEKNHYLISNEQMNYSSAVANKDNGFTDDLYMDQKTNNFPMFNLNSDCEDSESVKFKKLGRKRKNNTHSDSKMHTKFKYDNLIRKLRTYFQKSALFFFNTLIFEVYSEKHVKKAKIKNLLIDKLDGNMNAICTKEENREIFNKNKKLYEYFCRKKQFIHLTAKSKKIQRDSDNNIKNFNEIFNGPFKDHPIIQYLFNINILDYFYNYFLSEQQFVLLSHSDINQCVLKLLKNDFCHIQLTSLAQKEKNAADGNEYFQRLISFCKNEFLSYIQKD